MKTRGEERRGDGRNALQEEGLNKAIERIGKRRNGRKSGRKEMTRSNRKDRVKEKLENEKTRQEKQQ